MASAVAKKQPAKAPAKKMAGRPTALLEEVKEQTLLDYIRIGTPIRKAVTASGIAEKTFYNWMSRGLAERERQALVPDAKDNPTEVIFLQFLQRVEQARAEAITKKVAVIAKAGAANINFYRIVNYCTIFKFCSYVYCSLHGGNAGNADQHPARHH